MIVYFTGTGNSKYIAEKIEKITEDGIIDSTKYIKNNENPTLNSEKPFVFVCPTYGWRIPRVFDEFIRKSNFEGSKKAYFVMNCGSDIGNAEETISILCKEKGFEFMGIKEIIMPENYIAMFPVPGEEESAQIIEKADPIIEKAADEIKECKKFEERKLRAFDKAKSGFVNNIFYKKFVKADKFYAKDNCIGCGKCEELCMLNNIKLVENKPAWGSDCTHCMACICNCPVEAIEYGKKSVGKRRYLCK